MKLEQTEGGQWIVVDEDGDQVAGPFDTLEQAERWIKDRRPSPPRPKMR